MGIDHQLKKVEIPGLSAPCTICLLDFLATSFELAELAPHSRAPIREQDPVGIPVKLSPNIISYMPTIVYMEAGTQTL